MDIVLRDIISLGQCCPQVFDGRFHDGRIISEHTEACIASAAQKLADSIGCVAVVDVEDAVLGPFPVGWSSTDCADSTLFREHPLVVIFGDSELGLGVPPSASLLVPSLDTILFVWVRISIVLLRLSTANFAPPAIALFVNDVDSATTLATPGGSEGEILLAEPVTARELLSTPPSTPISLDRHETASRAIGSLIALVDVTKKVSVMSLLRGMAAQEADRFSRYPSSLGRALLGDCCGSSASAVTGSVGNRAGGGTGTVSWTHEHDYTSSPENVHLQEEEVLRHMIKTHREG